jgi:hypothetical protein
MNSFVKFIAFTFCMIPLLEIAARMIGPSPYDRPLRTHLVINRAEPSPTVQKIMELGPLILAEVGALVLMIDAMLRKYSSPKALPIAIAVLGLLTLGMSSIVYYLAWGRFPADVETNVATQFCENCVACSLDKHAPSTYAHHFIGTRLFGGADRCAACGSVVKTLWFCFLLPLIPFASYRILPVGEATVSRALHISRKTSFDLRHVLLVYAMDLTVVVIFVFVLRP